MYNLPLVVFFYQGLEFQDSICNGWYDLTIFCLNLSSIAIITVEGVDYCCIIHDISKHEAIHFLEGHSVFEGHG